ncbi:MAG: NUDIX hydrolase [Eubacterium sp.]|nr:NUDIX hydrolase [Eubacterium sp.]
MDLIERKLKYKAHRVKVYEDKLTTPDGETVFYDFVENRNGSGVLLIDDEERLLFVKQYRNCINDMDIEIPAGCAEINDFSDVPSNPSMKGTSDDATKPTDVRAVNASGYTREDFENPENPYYICAVREAEEETGLIPDELYFVNYIIAAVGLFSERTAVYIGTKLKKGEQCPDDDEYIDIIKLTLDEALAYIYDGKINDSKTILSILAYKDLKERGIL